LIFMSKTPSLKRKSEEASKLAWTENVKRTKKMTVQDDNCTPRRQVAPAIFCNPKTEEKKDNSSSSNIQVVVRMRPLNEKEKQLCTKNPTVEISGGAVLIPSQDKQFQYDHVADPGVTQAEFFALAGKKMVDCTLSGFNSSILAYGQTGSGKTFTMVGNQKTELRGMIPRVLEYLFARLEARQEAGKLKHFSCSCSFLEIYNETINDLLAAPAAAGFGDEESGVGRNLLIRQIQGSQGVYVDGLTQKPIASVDEAQHMLDKGTKSKRVEKTDMNSQSSRSHTVFSITVQCAVVQKDQTVAMQSSLLNLVDLAGSESQRTAGTAGERLREGSKINQSLSVLGNVMTALGKQETSRKKGQAKVHIPYRESKLTYLLKDSLGGSSKTCLIANISPAGPCLLETMSTLSFAARAKLVKNKAIAKSFNESSLDSAARLFVASLRHAHATQLKDAEAKVARWQSQAEQYKAEIQTLKKLIDSQTIIQQQKHQELSGPQLIQLLANKGLDVMRLVTMTHTLQSKLLLPTRTLQESSVLHDVEAEQAEKEGEQTLPIAGDISEQRVKRGADQDDSRQFSLLPKQAWQEATTGAEDDEAENKQMPEKQMFIAPYQQQLEEEEKEDENGHLEQEEEKGEEEDEQEQEKEKEKEELDTIDLSTTISSAVAAAAPANSSVRQLVDLFDEAQRAAAPAADDDDDTTAALAVSASASPAVRSAVGPREPFRLLNEGPKRWTPFSSPFSADRPVSNTSSRATRSENDAPVEGTTNIAPFSGAHKNCPGNSSKKKPFRSLRKAFSSITKKTPKTASASPALQSGIGPAQHLRFTSPNSFR